MPGKILVPPKYAKVKGPLVFLAGPIQGALDWQLRAIDFLRTAGPGLHVASPRRNYNGKFTKAMYNAQVDWETFYLNRAAEDGVILFWCAKEAEHRCDRAYAQTTRFEFGEWKTKHEYGGCKLVVGIEQGYTGEKYIRRRLLQDCKDVRIRSSLEQTCLDAIRLIYCSSSSS